MRSTLELPAECDSVLLGADELSARVAEMGAALTREHAGHELRLVTVLRGGVFFLADLCRAIDLPLTLDFLAVAPYRPGQGGAVRVTKDLDDNIEGAHVVLVEDVIDTGLTVNYVRSFLLGHDPASLQVVTLFDKPARRIADIPIDLRGFELSDRFLVGYGLDLRGRYRNLPYVATLREEAVFG
ncbi:MAG: hypoxanthine phosphoribosyltransferase [Actinobacteria bacterium]|nr:MAG: hypoxanthine phosphoribosyltransferase [Actinomycetota bacterium]